MRCQVPVLFLVFNRPRHTQVVLERIQQARPPKIYIHCDGARAHIPGEAEKVADVRAIVEKGIDWDCDVKTLYRTENKGLREGVFDALNWFFKNEPCGIILEDDCVPDLSFFPFCEHLLQFYADAPEIMHIGCSNLAEEQTIGLEESYVFSRFSFVWGWAGWRRAWEKMLLDLNGLTEFERSGKINQLVAHPKAQAYMLDKFHATQDRKNNSWAYAWFYSILKNNGLCIVPKVNLVQNVGVGEEGATNTVGRNERARRGANSIPFPLVHPPKRQPNPRLEQQFFYLTQKGKMRLWFWHFLKAVGLR